MIQTGAMAFFIFLKLKIGQNNITNQNGKIQVNAPPTSLGWKPSDNPGKNAERVGIFSYKVLNRIILLVGHSMPNKPNTAMPVPPARKTSVEMITPFRFLDNRTNAKKTEIPQMTPVTFCRLIAIS